MWLVALLFFLVVLACFITQLNNAASFFSVFFFTVPVLSVLFAIHANTYFSIIFWLYNLA